MASSIKVPAPARGPAGTRLVNLTLIALAVAGMTVAVQQTLVIPLLPRLMAEYRTDVTGITWVFTASLLAGAVATPLLTRFGDMYGKKRMALLALCFMISGSVACALAGDLATLIAGRVLQGCSAALIPLAIGMIRDTFPAARVTTAIGVVSATMGVGGTLGMITTGLIAARTESARPVFWVAAVLGAGALALVWTGVRDLGGRSGGRPDVPGAVLLAGWLICLLLAISEGNAWGWTSGGVLGLAAAAVVLCAVWVLLQWRLREPLVRLTLLAGRQSLSANVASMLLGFSMFASFNLITNFVQTDPAVAGYGLDGDVLDVGLLSLPQTVTMLGASVLAGRLAARMGAAFTLATGSVFAALSYVWLAVSNGADFDFLAFGAIQGIGFGIAYAALGTLAVQHVPMEHSGIASGINSLVRTAGGSVAGAATAAVLAAGVGTGGIPSRGAYVACFALAGAAAGLTAVVAAVHGVRHRPAAGTHPIEALETT